MKNFRFWLPVTAGLLWLSACSMSPGHLSDSQKEAVRIEVSESLGQLRQYYLQANWDAAASLYSDSPEFRIYENGVLQYESAEKVREALAGFPAGTRLETEYTDTEVRPLSKTVAAVGTLYETTIIDTTGSMYSYGGAMTMVWIKETDTWRVVNGHSSSPLPRRSW